MSFAELTNNARGGGGGGFLRDQQKVNYFILKSKTIVSVRIDSFKIFCIKFFFVFRMFFLVFRPLERDAKIITNFLRSV